MEKLNQFSELEIFKFLNTYEESERRIKIRLKGKETPSEYTPKQFEEIFGITYIPYLRFSNKSSLTQVIANCPWLLRFEWSGKENQDLGKQHSQELSTGYHAEVVIQWVDEEMGYGVFADAFLPAGSYIGEYTGVIKRLNRLRPEINAFCFHYPTKFWSMRYYVVDAMHAGNEMRFVNHSNFPNLRPACLVDRGLLHIVFFANEDISKGSELTFDYGPDFWQHRTR